MQKKIRIKDIAKMSGVSSGTVDRIIHNRGNVSEAARRAVETVLEQVNYKPNIHVSSLSLKRKYKVALTTPEVFPGEYWESIHNGIQRALDEYENIRIEYFIHTYDQYDINSCRKVFKKVAELPYDAVIIGPTFKEETLLLTKNLEEKNIPYLFVDSMLQNTHPLLSISSDHYKCGYLMGKLIHSITPEASDIGILQAVRIGNESANTTLLRKEGFSDFFTDQKITRTIHKIPFSVTEPQKNKKLMDQFFNSTTIGGMVVLNSRGSVIADYFSSNGIQKIRLVCVDLTTPNIEALKNGKIDFLIGQNPDLQGYFAMKTLIEYLIYKNPIIMEKRVPLDILTSETVNDYLEFSIINT